MNNDRPFNSDNVTRLCRSYHYSQGRISNTCKLPPLCLGCLFSPNNSNGPKMPRMPSMPPIMPKQRMMLTTKQLRPIFLLPIYQSIEVGFLEMPNRLSSSFSALSLTWKTTSQSPIRRPIGRRGISAPVPRRSIKRHQERHTKQAIHAFERIRGWSCSSPEPFIPVSMPFLCVPSAPKDTLS